MKQIKKHSLLIVIILVMTNNLEHLAYVHYNVSHQLLGGIGSIIHSIVSVFVIELSIIAFVRNGMKKFALLFTIFLFVLSMLYYPVRNYAIQGQWEELLAALVYSLLYTISIYMFSELYYSKIKAISEDKTQSTILGYTEEIEELKNTLRIANMDISIARNEVKEQKESWEEKAKQWDEACRCEYCGEMQESPDKKRIHKGRCSSNPSNNHQITIK